MSQLEFSVHGRQHEESERIMKKTSSDKRAKGQEMRREYHFDYRKSRPNRFAFLMRAGTVSVVLGPGLTSVFRSLESFNCLLRSVIKRPLKKAGGGLNRRSLCEPVGPSGEGGEHK